MRRLGPLLLIFLTSHGCLNKAEMMNIDRSPAVADTDERINWLATKNKPLGVVILIHGLNNDPNLFLQLANVLAENSYHVALLSLSGHRQDEDFQRSGSKANWLNDVEGACRLAGSKYPELPLYNVSFSLGSTLATHAADKPNAPCQFHKMVFFAPAFVLSGKIQLIRLLLPLKYFGLSIPSKNPKPYRAHDSTPLTAYSALFSLANSVRKISADSPLHKIDTLILLSQEDELISWDKLTQWLKRNSLNRWKLESVKPKASFEGSYEHLIVDEASLGSEEWKRVSEKILDFLQK